MQFWLKISNSLAACYGAAVVGLSALVMHIWQAQLTTADSIKIGIALAMLAFHTVALLYLGLKAPSRLLLLCAACWHLGVWLFCWTLLAGALNLMGYVAALAPYGGQSFILGWLVLAIIAWRRN